MKYLRSLLVVVIACLVPSRMVTAALLAAFVLCIGATLGLAYRHGAMDLRDELGWFNDGRQLSRLADNHGRVPLALIYLALFGAVLLVRFAMAEVSHW